MSYHGYIPFMKQYLELFERPNVLEIGVNKAQTTAPILQSLSVKKKVFNFVALDIKIYDEVKVSLSNFDLAKDQRFFLVNDNSLNFLKNTQIEGQFDLILLDGDHNYFTVRQELDLLEKFMHKNTILICDDYEGRWSQKDQFYAELEGYDNVDKATKRIDTEKHGVATAIDEFLSTRSHLVKMSFMKGEPVVIVHESNNTGIRGQAK